MKLFRLEVWTVGARITLAPSEKDGIYKRFNFKRYFSDFMTIEPCIEIWRYLQGEYLIRPNSKVTHLFFIYEGKAVVSPIQDDYSSSHLIFEAPWFTGEVNLFRDEQTVSGVKAIKDCLCIQICTDPPVRDILLNDIVFLREMCLHFCNKVVDETKNAMDYQSLNATQQLVKYLQNTMLESKLVEIDIEKYADSMRNKNSTADNNRHIQSTLSKLEKAGVLDKIHGRKKKEEKLPSYKIIDISRLEQIGTGELTMGEL